MCEEPGATGCSHRSPLTTFPGRHHPTPGHRLQSSLGSTRPLDDGPPETKNSWVHVYMPTCLHYRPWSTGVTFPAQQELEASGAPALPRSTFYTFICLFPYPFIYPASVPASTHDPVGEI